MTEPASNKRPLSLTDIAKVEDALRDAGYWYPPDAITAAHEGRDTYLSLGGHAWPMGGHKLEVIKRALKVIEPHSLSYQLRWWVEP